MMPEDRTLLRERAMHLTQSACLIRRGVGFERQPDHVREREATELEREADRLNKILEESDAT